MWEDEREVLSQKGSVTIQVAALPGRSRTVAKQRLADGTVKIEVAAAPERNKANDELIEFLADAFQVPETHVRLLMGGRSRRKLFKVTL